MFKKCSKCKTSNRAYKSGAYCSDCHRSYTRTRSRRTIIADLKDVPCKDCGVKYPAHVMDFDHMPGVEKKVNLSRMLGYSEDQIRKEASKCEIVCANCHRERTFRRLPARL